MNIKKLKIKADNGFDEFTIDILKSLNLFDSKKNCLLDFDDRMNSYFQRHKKLVINIVLSEKELFETLFKKKFYSLKRYKREIPEGYPFGASNMETQAFYNPIILDEQYYEDKEKIEDETQIELDFLISKIDELNTKYSFQIEVKE